MSAEHWNNVHDDALALGFTRRVAVQQADDATDDLGYEWHCAECDLVTEIRSEAGDHTEWTSHWLWRFPERRNESTKADMEIHASDAGGYYVSPAPWKHTWHDHWTKLQKR